MKIAKVVARINKLKAKAKTKKGAKAKARLGKMKTKFNTKAAKFQAKANIYKGLVGKI